jgi:MFS family permease
MNETDRDDRGLLQALLGDGRPLLIFTGMSLALSGAFALFLSATGQFLPHDVQFLGMGADELCAVKDCRIVHFMFHDRVSFGGTLVAVGSLYMWMAEFPLRRGEVWSWWLFAVSGIIGFGSFLAYLGYGYLDTWHGLATLLLLPCFIMGLARSYTLLPQPRPPGSLLKPSVSVRWKSPFGLGRLCLLGTAAGMILGGLTIMTVGMTIVFVPQDLTFMGVTASELHAINPRLIPLIAHDRAGFGGGICVCGVIVLFCVWCGMPSRSLWQVLCLAGVVGFSTAIGTHPIVGYNDLGHLAPAMFGAMIFIVGLLLTYRPMCSKTMPSVRPEQSHNTAP